MDVAQRRDRLPRARDLQTGEMVGGKRKTGEGEDVFRLLAGQQRVHWKEVSVVTDLQDSCVRLLLTCVLSLAMAEMKLLMKEVYSKCRTTVSKDMKGDMSLSDQIISSRPSGQTCLLAFERI